MRPLFEGGTRGNSSLPAASKRTDAAPETPEALSDDRIQRTLRFSRDLFEYLDRRATTGGESFQGYVTKKLTEIMIEDDEAPPPPTTEQIAPAVPSAAAAAEKNENEDEDENNEDDLDLITLAELAKETGVTVRTAQNWSDERSFPPVIKKERKTRLYEKEAALLWVSGSKPATATRPGGPTVPTPGLTEAALEEIVERVAKKLGNAGEHYFKAAL